MGEPAPPEQPDPVAQRCPSCGSIDVARSHRRGFEEVILLRLLHRAPYRCLACDTRFAAATASWETASLTRYFRQARVQRAVIAVVVTALFVLGAFYLLSFARNLLY